ncbi:MAG: acyloxyacyl hydrolase [Phycisphaerales bacterium]
MHSRLSGPLLACAVGATAASADHRAEIRFDAREAIALAVAQPEAESPDAAPDEVHLMRFGDASNEWWATAGVAGGFVVGREDTFGQGFLSLTTFIADRFEVGAEFGGWGIDQDGAEDTPGASAGVLFRWHFLMDEEDRDWSVFASAGVGMLFTDEDVPFDGTKYNFTPTAGVGFTHRLGDGDNRLIGGLRWQHISNARTAGGDENGGRDFATFYVGVMFPF